ncbi:MAG: YbaB/EbfC family nucleoid-associated protein [Patescibacteria group bacterium]|jgi:DNA-binding YbaB/EbfC family protein
MVFDKAKRMWQLQSKARAIQKELKELMFEGIELGGKVKVIVDGEQKVQSVEIAEDLLAPTEKAAVERFVRQAANAAITKAQQASAQKMKSVAGDLGLNI